MSSSATLLLRHISYSIINLLLPIYNRPLFLWYNLGMFLVNFLNSNDGFIQVILVLALVVVTGLYFLQTRRQANILEHQVTEMKNQEAQRRKDEADKENRDRKERYLNEIIQWANDVNTRVYNISILTGDRYNEDRNTLWILGGLHNKGKYIKTTAEYIFGNPLKDSISDTGQAMSRYAGTIAYFVERELKVFAMPDNERDRIVKELDEAIAEDLRNSKGDIPSFAMEDAIKSECATSMRDKAILTLDICVVLKDDLLNK